MKNSTLRLIVTVILGIFIWTSCSKGDPSEKTPPSVSFENGAGIFEVKVGKTITLRPTITNAQNPVYTWEIDGKVVGRGATFEFSSETAGQYFLTFKVKSTNGFAEKEARVDVIQLAPPKVSLPAQEGVINAVAGRGLNIEPSVLHGEGADYKWLLDGVEVSTEEIYAFNSTRIGEHSLALIVTNEDGEGRDDAVIRVGDSPFEMFFEHDAVNVSLGRAIYLAPFVSSETGNTVYMWGVNGVVQVGETQKIFAFTPAALGTYTVTVAGKQDGKTTIASVAITCVAPEGTYRRPAGPGSSPAHNKIYEFLPGPGQFTNEGYTATTMEQANLYAQGRLTEGAFVSLGGFGGYIVVGFDHSIDNVTTGDGYDFAIMGNAFAGGSEPGIVWVMQDNNGNGLPDDTWYELTGSEADKATTVRQYAVTYFKPAGNRMKVSWADNMGRSGTVEVNGFHTQDTFYPQWVTTSSYTLYGTCLGLRSTMDPSTGFWYNEECDWGYADNFGQDYISHYTKLDITNAVNPDGSPANLEYIDFIKVQTGVNGKSGILGEISTEVLGFRDINIR